MPFCHLINRGNNGIVNQNSRVVSGHLTFASVPMEKSLASRHGGELVPDAFEEGHDGSVVADERRRHLQS